MKWYIWVQVILAGLMFYGIVAAVTKKLVFARWPKYKTTDKWVGSSYVRKPNLDRPDHEYSIWAGCFWPLALPIFLGIRIADSIKVQDHAKV
jgi:hypothetical protein